MPIDAKRWFHKSWRNALCVWNACRGFQRKVQSISFKRLRASLHVYAGMPLEPLEDLPGVRLVPSRRQRPDKALQTAHIDRLLEEDARPARVLLEEHVLARAGVVAFTEADRVVVFPLNCRCSCWLCLFEEVADHLRPGTGSSVVDAGGCGCRSRSSEPQRARVDDRLPSVAAAPPRDPLKSVTCLKESARNVSVSVNHLGELCELLSEMSVAERDGSPAECFSS